MRGADNEPFTFTKLSAATERVIHKAKIKADKENPDSEKAGKTNASTNQDKRRVGNFLADKNRRT